MNAIAAICGGAAVFVAVWTLGELLWVQRPGKWRPSPPGPGLQHGEYAEWTAPSWMTRFWEHPDDYPGVQRIERQRAHEDRCRDLSCTCNLDRTP